MPAKTRAQDQLEMDQLYGGYKGELSLSEPTETGG
jgi:hypothetical protein